MQGDDAIRALGQKTQFLFQIAQVHRWLYADQGVDHDVSHKLDPLGWNTFMSQILISILRRSPQQVRYGVGQNSVDFFGHGAVETAKTGFEMGNRQLKFFGGQCAGDR